MHLGHNNTNSQNHQQDEEWNRNVLVLMKVIKQIRYGTDEYASFSILICHITFRALLNTLISKYECWQWAHITLLRWTLHASRHTWSTLLIFMKVPIRAHLNTLSFKEDQYILTGFAFNFRKASVTRKNTQGTFSLLLIVRVRTLLNTNWYLEVRGVWCRITTIALYGRTCKTSSITIRTYQTIRIV